MPLIAYITDMITYRGDTLPINLGILSHNDYVKELVITWKKSFVVANQDTIPVRR